MFLFNLIITDIIFVCVCLSFTSSSSTASPSFLYSDYQVPQLVLCHQTKSPCNAPTDSLWGNCALHITTIWDSQTQSKTFLVVVTSTKQNLSVYTLEEALKEYHQVVTKIGKHSPILTVESKYYYLMQAPTSPQIVALLAPPWFVLHSVKSSIPIIIISS